MRNKVLQFEGDIRMWSIADNGDESPVLFDATDIFGNVPVEASAAAFAYEAGEAINVVTKRRGVYNQSIYAKQQPGTSTLSLTLVACPPALLARVFYGEAAEVTVTAGVVTDEVVTFAADALSQPLANSHIATSPAPVVTDGDVVTYTAGTDYVIDYTLGRIRRVAAGAIGAAGVVEVTYTKKAYVLTSIRGGVAPQQNFRIHGNLLNQPDSQDMFLNVWQANLSTDGDIDLFSSEPITITLTGPMVTPDDKTEPYEVKSYEVA